MNPQEIFCPNIDCPARGQIGKGNIHVHSQKDKRYICEVCGKRNGLYAMFASAPLQREKAPCSIAYTAIRNWSCW